MKPTNEAALEVIVPSESTVVLAAATPIPLEESLEAIIVAAAAGDRLARRMLRPAVSRLARDTLPYVDAADRVTDLVLASLGRTCGGVGLPRPGNAVRWLSNVVRATANEDFEETSLEQWEEWDPPQGPEEPEG